MNKPMNLTRVTVEVEVTHWDTTDPIGAIQMVTRNLAFPAIKSVRVIKAETNYNLNQFLLDEFSPVNIPDWLGVKYAKK